MRDMISINYSPLPEELSGIQFDYYQRNYLNFSDKKICVFQESKMLLTGRRDSSADARQRVNLTGLEQKNIKSDFFLRPYFNSFWSLFKCCFCKQKSGFPVLVGPRR